MAQPGLIRRLLTDPRPPLDELRDRYGPVVGLGAGPLRLAVVGGPAAIRELFAVPTDAFQWGHRFNVLGFVVGARSLIVSDGAQWKHRRSAVQAGFSRRRLNGWIDTIVQRTDAHIDALLARIDTPSAVVDLDWFARNLVQELTVRILFGERLAERSAEIAGLFRSAQDYLESPAYRQIPHPLPIGRRSRVRTDMAALRSIIDEQIAFLRSAPSGDPLDVLESLLVDGGLDDEEIVDQVITLVGAGLDTTSASVSWMLWCTTLSRDKLWQRLRSEADEVLGDGSYDATHLALLELADRTMRETTRLHPAGSISPRMTARDVVIDGYRIPKGTLILWSAHLAGRDPAAWDEPSAFDPDRFLDLSPDQKVASDAAWVPFGGGARNCIGFALAQMELTLIVARLAQRLDVEATATTMPKAVGMVVNRPDGGAPMRIAARH